MLSEVVLVLCLFISSSSSYGPNYQEPSVYTSASYAPPANNQQQLPQQLLHLQPPYTTSFGPFSRQPYQYQSQAPNFYQPENPWSQQSTLNSYYWLNSQQHPPQQPFPGGQSPFLVNYFQPQLPSYPPNSFIVIYYRAKAAKNGGQSLQSTPADQQSTTAPRIGTSEPSSSNRYPNICKGDGIIRHPDDCLKFIRCRLSLRHHVYYYEERSCPQGLAFDPELESCNYQANVATCSQLQSASAPATTTGDATPQQQTAQTLLTYHGELSEPEKVGEESSSSNPSLYMHDLPQPLSDSSEEGNNQLESNSAVISAPADGGSHYADTADSSIASAPLAGKNADGGDVTGLKSPPPATKTVKKPAQSDTRKSPSRKVSTKRPSSGATKSGSTKLKPVVQEKEVLPARRTQQVETFTIGDSAENARMMLDNEDIVENVDQHGQQPVAKPAFQNQVNSNIAAPESAAPAPNTNHQPNRSSVHYEDDAANEEETLASSV